MSRKHILIWSAVAVGVAVLVLFGYQRRAALQRALPAWLDTQQPPDNVMADLATLSEVESWAANRCRHMSASCSAHTAGRRVRRTYPPTLAASEGSFIRGSVSLEGGV